MKIKIIANDKGNPPGKLADVELHFEPADGPLSGLKLIGFGIWERRTGTGRNVTFPARSYSVNGERRSFALLRPQSDTRDQDRIRDLVLEAYAEYEELSETGSAPDLITPAALKAPGAPAVDVALKTIAERADADDRAARQAERQLDSRITSLAPEPRKEPTPPAILF